MQRTGIKLNEKKELTHTQYLHAHTFTRYRNFLLENCIKCLETSEHKIWMSSCSNKPTEMFDSLRSSLIPRRNLHISTGVSSHYMRSICNIYSKLHLSYLIRSLTCTFTVTLVRWLWLAYFDAPFKFNHSLAKVCSRACDEKRSSRHHYANISFPLRIINTSSYEACTHLTHSNKYRAP